MLLAGWLPMQVAQLEGGQAAAISSAAEFWRDALTAGRARPAHLRAVLYGAADRAGGVLVMVLRCSGVGVPVRSLYNA